MPEVAPVNTGAVRWPDPDSAHFAVREMQIKLHRWAGEDDFRRFGDLLNLVYDPAFLVHAWERVASNVGARTPGIDRATVALIETWVGVEAFLEHIRHALKSGAFEPVEVRQVMIPKASGKLRALGIPTVADRWSRPASKQYSNPSSKRTSCRVRTGSALTGVHMMRLPRFTICRPGPTSSTGSWRQTSRRASTRSITQP